MNKLKAKNTLYNDPMYDVVVDSRMLEQHLKEKNQQIAKLQKQLADKKRDYKVLKILFDIVNNPKKDAMLKKIQGLQKQVEEKEQIIQMQQNIKRYDIGEMLTENIKLRQQLHSQPAEIVGKIRSKCCVEDKCKDGSFVLGINEKDLDTILKWYGGKYERK